MSAVLDEITGAERGRQGAEQWGSAERGSCAFSPGATAFFQHWFCHMLAVGDDSDALTLLRCPVHLIPIPRHMHAVLSASEAVLAHLLCVP